MRMPVNEAPKERSAGFLWRKEKYYSMKTKITSRLNYNVLAMLIVTYHRFAIFRRTARIL